MSPLNPCSCPEPPFALRRDHEVPKKWDQIGSNLTDKISGAKADRPGLQEALAYLREDDTFLVWRLDRLGRSLKHLIETVNEIEERGIGVQSLKESIDTTTSSGRLVFHFFGALAEFERILIRERTRAGLEAARARGRKGGRSKALDAKKRKLLGELYDSKKHTVKEICDVMGISRPTLNAYLRVGEK